MIEKQRKRMIGHFKCFFKSIECVDGAIHINEEMLPLAEEICNYSQDMMTIADAHGLIMYIIFDQQRSVLANLPAANKYSISDEDSERMANNIVTWVADLPHDYRIFVHLPIECSGEPKPYTYNGWSLVGKDFEETGSGYCQEGKSDGTVNNALCISFNFKGAISKHSSQIALDEISIKVCLIIFVFRAIATDRGEFHPQFQYSGRGWLFAEHDKWGIQKLNELADLQKLFYEQRVKATDQNSLQECVDMLGRIESIPTRERTKIASSIHWYVAFLADNSFTSSVVKLSIGVDALFGNSDHERGLKNTIADRVAYLLGGNMTERDRLSNRVKRFYDLRSKIVHGDITVLRAKEREICWELQMLLEQALITEIRSYS